MNSKAALLLSDLKRIIPIGLVAGAGMETFMIHTGFYDVALRKAAERRHAQLQEDERRRKRMEELNIKVQ